MQLLTPDYLAEIARQIASLGAVLGGFAVAFLGTLLNAAPGRRTATWAAGAAAISAAAFIVATIAAVALLLALHPRGVGVAPPTMDRARAGMAVAFLLGIYSLLASLGLSGWARSPGLGRMTAVTAALGAVAVTLALVSVGD